MPPETVTITGSLAQGATFANFAKSLVQGANDIIIPVLVSFAFIAFLWGVVKYFFIEGGSEEAHKTGRQFIVWGLIGMVVLFSVWGIVHILLDTLGFGT